MNNEEQWYCFTFGAGQEYPNRYVRIFGTFSSARDEMFNRFGAKWSMQYPENSEKFQSDANKWGWKELK